MLRTKGELVLSCNAWRLVYLFAGTIALCLES